MLGLGHNEFWQMMEMLVGEQNLVSLEISMALVKLERS